MARLQALLTGLTDGKPFDPVEDPVTVPRWQTITCDGLQAGDGAFGKIQPACNAQIIIENVLSADIAQIFAEPALPIGQHGLMAHQAVNIDDIDVAGEIPGDSG